MTASEQGDYRSDVPLEKGMVLRLAVRLCACAPQARAAALCAGCART